MANYPDLATYSNYWVIKISYKVKVSEANFPPEQLPSDFLFYLSTEGKPQKLQFLCPQMSHGSWKPYSPRQVIKSKNIYIYIILTFSHLSVKELAIKKLRLLFLLAQKEKKTTLKLRGKGFKHTGLAESPPLYYYQIRIFLCNCISTQLPML